MLRSMTGFGAAETENESYKVHVEVKSVNQRFLDLAFHMPRLLNVWEDELRNRIKEKAARGKMDVYVTLVDKREMEACVRVNHGLAKGYHGALNEISDLLHLPRNGDVTAIAAYPDVLVMEERTSLEGGEEVLFPALEQALESLDAMRQREGMNIQQDFQQRLAELESMVDKVSALAPEIVEAYRQRLQKMMAELLADKDFDETRIIQETALYADKVNYNFMQWTLKRNAGAVHFTDEQMEWLRLVKDHIAASLSISADDLDYTPFDRKGGLGRFYEVFGDQYLEILDEMNIELVA